MWNPDDNDSNNQDDYLNNSDDVRPESGTADGPELNEQQFEQSVTQRDSDPGYNADSNTDEVRFNSQEQGDAVNQRDNDIFENAEHPDAGSGAQQSAQPPLTTQGDSAEIEENLGGTTNLSLDQLKKEHDPEDLPNE